MQRNFFNALAKLKLKTILQRLMHQVYVSKTINEFSRDSLYRFPARKDFDQNILRILGTLRIFPRYS